MDGTYISQTLNLLCDPLFPLIDSQKYPQNLECEALGLADGRDISKEGEVITSTSKGR